MKRPGLIFGVTLLTLLAAPCLAAERFSLEVEGKHEVLYEGSYALLIGASAYQHLDRLDHVKTELDEVEKFLHDEQGFIVTRVDDPDDNALKAAFDDFIKKHGYNQNLRLLIYFSGHGFTYPGETEGFLLPVNALKPLEERIGFLQTAYSMNDVMAGARKIRAKHVLYVFDSCFSGAIFQTKNGLADELPEHISRIVLQPVRQFITAGSANEKVQAKSTFTPAFINALRYRLADINHDGYVSGSELGVYLKGEVPKYVKQNPQFGKITDIELAMGEFMFKVGKSSGIAPSVAAPGDGSTKGAGDEVVSSTPAPGTEFRECDACPVMVSLPGGSFSMGSQGSEAFDDEKQIHEVQVTSFALAKYEISKGQFETFVKETKYITEAEKGEGCYGWTGTEWKQDKKYNWRDVGFKQDNNYPVVCVSWRDSLAYTEWLSRKTGETYRLPTEAEWEYAARANTTTERYWGDKPEQACVYANVYDEASKQKNKLSFEAHDCTDGYANTAPIGKFKPNDFGLYDIIGNIWEWTCSEWSGTYDGKELKCSTGASVLALRVSRGGAWDVEPHLARSAVRGTGALNYGSKCLGFRPARIF